MWQAPHFCKACIECAVSTTPTTTTTTTNNNTYNTNTNYRHYHYQYPRVAVLQCPQHRVPGESVQEEVPWESEKGGIQKGGTKFKVPFCDFIIVLFVALLRFLGTTRGTPTPRSQT